MATAKSHGEAIRRFILQNIAKHPTDIARRVSTRFEITRQAVHKHITRLIEEGLIAESGQTRSRSYRLTVLVDWKGSYAIKAGLAEDVVWIRDIRPQLGALPENVLTLWQHGFTEMFNNAIDHSEGTHIRVELQRTAVDTEIAIADDGVGIFRKIRDQMGLLDERHAILELAKGKLTTAPAQHSGEGIFFTSRMFDSFDILSGGVSFSHAEGDAHDWIHDDPQFRDGTTVWMRLPNQTTRTTKKIFDEYVSGEDYDFSRTVVPVVLAQHLGEPLLSRSQAKRVLARVELFRTVVFDFSQVQAIGQAFADEIFRVFAQSHPQIDLQFIHANADIAKMIGRSRSKHSPNRADKKGT